MGSCQSMYVDGGALWMVHVVSWSLVQTYNTPEALKGLPTYANDTREGERGSNQCMLVQKMLFAMVTIPHRL
jgi:hypothetical protein